MANVHVQPGEKTLLHDHDGTWTLKGSHAGDRLRTGIGIA
jgi:hypothetical protein